MLDFGVQIPLEGFLCKSFFHCLVDPSLLGKSVFLVFWRIKVPRKVRFFIWQVLHDHANTVDRLVRKLSLLVGPFCCILCWKAEEDLDHVLWRCEFACCVWILFPRRFGMMCVHHRDVRDMIEEFLLNSLFGK